MKVYDTVKMIPVEDIHPYPNNPRKNDATVAALAKIIKEVGFNVPIAVDSDGVIVKGHSRYRAALAIGMTEIPCIVLEGTAEQMRQDRVLDNKLSDMSSYDLNKLQYELRDVEITIPELHFERKAEAKVEDVTDAEYKAREEKTKTFNTADENRQYIEVACPKCGETFLLDMKEVAKYSQKVVAND